MAGLLDAFAPASPYQGLLSPDQNDALRNQGLLAYGAALSQAAMPSRMPVPLGAAMGQAAMASMQAQNQGAAEAAKLAMLQPQIKMTQLKLKEAEDAEKRKDAWRAMLGGEGASPSAPIAGNAAFAPSAAGANIPVGTMSAAPMGAPQAPSPLAVAAPPVAASPVAAPPLLGTPGVAPAAGAYSAPTLAAAPDLATFVRNLPAPMRATLAGMPEEEGMKFVTGLFQKQLETSQIEPIMYNGVQIGTRNRLSGEEKFRPKELLDNWKDIGGGKLLNTFNNDTKMVDPTMAKITNNLVMPPQEGEEAKKVGGFFGETFNNLQNATLQNPKKRADLQRLDTLLDPAYTGAGGETVQAIKKAAQGLGIDLGNVSGPEAAQALSNAMALQLRNPAGGAGMPGAMSDQDRNFLQSMVPGLSVTAQGRKLIVDYSQKLLEREDKVAQMARDYRQKPKAQGGGGGHMDEGFFNELAKYSAEHPIFTPADVQRLQAAASAPPVPAPLVVPGQRGAAPPPTGAAAKSDSDLLRSLGVQ